MRIHVLLPLCLAVVVHAQSPAQSSRTAITLRVDTDGVPAADAPAVVRAVRAAFEADSTFRVISLASRDLTSGYFDFTIEKRVANAEPVAQRVEVARFSAAVTCAIEGARQTLRLRITDARDGRVMMETFAILRDDQSIAMAADQTTHDLARVAAKLLR